MRPSRVHHSFPAWLRTWWLSLLCALIPGQGYPEGSCTWDEARALLEQSPDLLSHVEQTLTVEPTGFALRLGSHYTDLSGLRVAPFTFRALSKGNPPVALELVIEAELAFFDHAGKPVAATDSQKAHQVRQTLTHVLLRPLPLAPLPEANAEAMNQRTAWIIEQDAAIRKESLAATAVPFPPGNSLYAGESRFLRDPASKALRSILVRASQAADKQSSFEEQYQFAGGELVLFFRRESNWIMHPENAALSINHVVETRYFFHEGAIYLALEKRYQGTDPALLDREAQSAPEQRLALSGAESMQILSRASRLSLAETPEALLAVYAPAP